VLIAVGCPPGLITSLDLDTPLLSACAVATLPIAPFTHAVVNG